MTLKEKFDQVIQYPFSEHKEQMKVLKEENSSNYEKIAEDFALEFGKWLNNKVINPSGKHHNLLGIVKVDTLLVIFKKEKGL